MSVRDFCPYAEPLLCVLPKLQITGILEKTIRSCSFQIDETMKGGIIRGRDREEKEGITLGERK
jgi:hypothetical protein